MVLGFIKAFSIEIILKTIKDVLILGVLSLLGGLVTKTSKTLSGDLAKRMAATMANT